MPIINTRGPIVGRRSIVTATSQELNITPGVAPYRDSGNPGRNVVSRSRFLSGLAENLKPPASQGVRILASGSHSHSAALLSDLPVDERIAMEVFANATSLRTSFLAGGYSGNAVVRIDVDDTSYVLKMTQEHAGAQTLAAARQEIKLAVWASHHGLGPLVVACDMQRGFFIATFIDPEYAA